MRMGAPVWDAAAKYVRNSPITYADRIDTPLMIVQGDMDFVPMQDGEAMFTRLWRMGKRVEFVRYWGEGHAFSSPANIRDEWRRQLAWFATFLKAHP
jgi:dipeptidyl aminopeptidase/acylaminoacyl peptidase